jgi:probable HAF family extracellular repeat protein
MKAKSILLSAIVISILLIQVAFATPPRYEVIDLGTLGGTYSRAFAINDAGQVVGVSQTIESGGHAFFWDRRNGMIDLGVLYEGDMSAAYGVNDHGQVVGFSGPDDRDAFIWDSENGMRCPEGFGSEARAINNAGQVVVNTEFHSYLWHPNEVVIVLGSLGTDRVSACALNSAGQVVGHAYTSISEYHAFLWDRATGMRDLGTLGGTCSMAFGINDTGQVVGKSRTTTGDWREHAFLWDSDTGMVDLGEGRALAINNAGQVVGYMSSSGPAFYWDSDIGMIQLSDLLLPNSGWRELHYASDINKRGQVVGMGRTDNGKIHGFLMTPVPPKIIYVDDDASGANNGSSWDDAFNYLQDALTAVWDGDEIRVAQGIYKPDQGEGVTPGDREATFQLINGVTIKGGYAGTGAPEPNARDIELYETILTGDLNGNDVELENLDWNTIYLFVGHPSRAENSCHVATGSCAGWCYDNLRQCLWT